MSTILSNSFQVDELTSIRRRVNPMAQAMWNEIQKAETEASSLVEEAKQRKTEILKQAREKAAEIVKNSESEAIAAGEALLQEIAAKNQQAAEIHHKQLEDEIRNLENLANERMAEAVKIIIEKVVS